MLFLDVARSSCACACACPTARVRDRAIEPHTVVDDNEINRAVIVRYLAKAVQDNKAAVITAANGVEALAAATTPTLAPLDLILMDVEMPDMDGLEATRQIRAHEVLTGASAVPILGVSGNARQVRVQDAQSCAWACAYVYMH